MPETKQGGVRVRAAPRGQSSAQVKAGLLAGESMKHLAKRLGMHRSSIQEHARRLLLSGEIAKAEGRYFPGPTGGGAGSHGKSDHAPVLVSTTQDPAPPQVRIDVATDGKRIFRVTRPPAPGLVDKLPGFAGTKPKGKGRKQLLHKIAHTVAGRTWNLWLEESMAKGSWSLWVGQVLPPVPFAQFQAPGEDPDDAYDRLTIQTVVDWATKASIGLEPIPRRSRAVSVTYPGIVEGASWRSAPSDADQTPPDPSGRLALEVRGGELQEFVNNGPEWKNAMIREFQGQQAVLQAALKTQGMATAVIAGLTQHSALATSSIPQTGIAARPTPPASIPSFSDFI